MKIKKYFDKVCPFTFTDLLFYLMANVCKGCKGTATLSDYKLTN